MRKFLKVILLTVIITLNTVAILKGLPNRAINEHKLPTRTVKVSGSEVEPVRMPTFLRF